jgi:hypothetical protein
VLRNGVLLNWKHFALTNKPDSSVYDSDRGRKMHLTNPRSYDCRPTYSALSDLPFWHTKNCDSKWFVFKSFDHLCNILYCVLWRIIIQPTDLHSNVEDIHASLDLVKPTRQRSELVRWRKLVTHIEVLISDSGFIFLFFSIIWYFMRCFCPKILPSFACLAS